MSEKTKNKIRLLTIIMLAITSTLYFVAYFALGHITIHLIIAVILLISSAIRFFVYTTSKPEILKETNKNE